jgi:Tfp pilus assembly protein PilF
LLYKYSFELHNFCTEASKIEINLPRVNLTTMERDEFSSIPKLYIDLKVVFEFDKNGTTILDSIDYRRDQKYDDEINRGHEAIYHKDTEVALEAFQKACCYRETAEALTLIGWVYSMLGDNFRAQKQCLKAIKLDKDYGPAYNDIGSYLLTDGQINDSIRWFELAKKAIKYQNREYPYINLGRAYMTQKKYEKALNEFSKALALAPYHEELKTTIERINELLNREVHSAPSFEENVTPIN